MADGQYRSPKGGKPKGLPKTGGRKKGTPNAVSRDLRARISAFLDENFDTAVKAWKQLNDPKDKLKLYIDLACFGVPKLQAVQLEADIRKEGSVEDDLRQLSSEEE